MNKHISLLAIFLCLSANYLSAQPSRSAICQEGDCSSAIFSIQFDEPFEPTSPTGYTEERTQKFKEAYITFQGVKKLYTGQPEWNIKHEAFELGGKSCLRHYQLESAFAIEYVKNSDFKKFVDEQGVDSDNFVENGFEDSRRGINLENRMNRYCSRELKKLGQKPGPVLADLPKIYQKLGQELGYFDEKGNLLKPLDTPPNLEEEPEKNGNRKDQIAQMQKQLDQLLLGVETQNKIDELNKNLMEARPRVDKLGSLSKNLIPIVGAFLPIPVELLGDITNIKNRLEDLLNVKLKFPKLDLFDKIKKLFNRGEKLDKEAQEVLDQSNTLKDKVDDISQKTEKIKDKIDKGTSNLGDLKKVLDKLAKEKAALNEELENNPQKELEELEQKVKDIVGETSDFSDEVEKETKARDKLLDELKLLEKRKDELAQELEELQETTTQTTKEKEELEKETIEAEKEMEEAKRAEKGADEASQKAQELEREKEAIRKEFGKDIDLKPVSAEEWAENFEIKREYWDAVFYPDNEVVQGYKGRYFEVRLKDASKNVKLLFGPGKYYMDKKDFRDSYGSVIGAFVMEALHSMKEAEQGKVQLFVQGSADSAGQNTFRGKMDNKFLYNEITMLPYDEATDGFFNVVATKRISSTSFTNSDLPNLRGNFLKEMITVYSKKLKPVLLEGIVEKEVNEGNRNAVIYLFIPETLQN